MAAIVAVVMMDCGRLSQQAAKANARAAAKALCGPFYEAWLADRFPVVGLTDSQPGRPPGAFQAGLKGL
jgi:hypothetical protein